MTWIINIESINNDGTKFTYNYDRGFEAGNINVDIMIRKLSTCYTFFLHLFQIRQIIDKILILVRKKELSVKVLNQNNLGIISDHGMKSNLIRI